MFPIDPHTPNNTLKDSQTSAAEKAQIIGTKIAKWTLFLSVVIGITTLFFAVRTYQNTDQITHLDSIIEQLHNEDTTLVTQVGLAQEDLHQGRLIDSSINAGLLIQNGQYQKLELASNRDSTALFYKKQNDIYNLYLTNKFLRILDYNTYWLMVTNAFLNKDETTAFVLQIDSAISTQLKNNFLNSSPLGEEWYNLSISVKGVLNSLNDPDFEHTMGGSGEFDSLSEYLENLFQKSQDQMEILIPKIDSLLKTQASMHQYYR